VSDYFNETHQQARLSAHKFIETHVRPHIGEWEEAGEFPRDIYRKAGEAGLLGIGFPEALGGTGEGDIFLKVAVSEELMRSTSGGFVAGIGIDQNSAQLRVMLAYAVQGRSGYAGCALWIFVGWQPNHQIGFTNLFQLSLCAGAQN